MRDRATFAGRRVAQVVIRGTLRRASRTETLHARPTAAYTMTAETNDAARLDAEALAALERGDIGAAEARFRDAIARYGPRADRLAMLGQILLRLARPKEAARALTEASAALPDNAAINAALGVALVQSGEAAAALGPLEQAVTLAPSNHDAWNALGLARAGTGDVDGAGAAFERALAAAPRFTPALVNWCDSLVSAGRLAEAIELAANATAKHPDDPDAWFNLGRLQMNELSLDAARDAFLRVAALQQANPSVHVNLGLIEQWAGHLDEAERQFRRARALDPGNANARFGLAMTLLKLRRSDEGWALYAQGRSGMVESFGRIRARPWDGRRLAEGTLIVCCDHGLGDVLQFARFAPLARERVARVVVYCDGYHATARRLLDSLRGVDAVLGADADAPAVTATCAMSELPHLLHLGSDAFRPVEAYLAPPSDAVRRWSARVAGLRGRKVGVCWGGNPRPDESDWRRIDLRRSIPAQRLAWLAAVPGISLVSLQKGAASGDKDAFGAALHDWTDALTDFAETAALIANLDVVISVDTSVAHCAGAIGAPVFLLDRFDGDWRWGTDANAPGWYPNLRVFRQPSIGDWRPAFDALARALAEPV